jgi:ABC-type transport system involved in multi-copper enzyme maturation permease subunit
MVVLPVVIGLFLGIALAGKEIDRGTTVFAWSLTPSRRRWLFGRVAPVAVVIVLASLAAGILADRLEGLRDPGVDPALTFEHLGIRGIVVAGETLLVFGIALAAGAILGRILPALLLALAVSIGAIVGGYLINDAMLKTETVLVPGVDGGPTGPARWRTVDFKIQAPTGEIMTWQEAYDRYGDPGAVEGGDAGVNQLRTILEVNPAELYPLVTDRMALLFAALGLSAIVIAFAAVDRRRP